jgi:perosamine synthetase
MNTIYRAKPHIPEDSKEWILEKYQEILDTGGLIQGKYVKQFEDEVCQRVGVKNAVATTSCGTGLETVLISSGINNKQFIVPTQTFAASVNCIIRTGNVPLIVDVDSKTQCLSLDIIKDNMNENVEGVVLVHMSGLIPPDILEIEQFCFDNNLFLVIDEAHSYGSQMYNQYRDEVRSAGSFGNAGVFSFYPSKIITTGEGGMITTNDEELAEKCRVVRNHGTDRNDGEFQGLDYGYTCVEPSTNYRMSEFHAVLGISQNKCVDDFLFRRNHIADLYTKRIDEIDWLETPYIDDMIYQSWWQYIVKITDERDRTQILLKLLNDFNIPTANAYQPLCHQQKIYEKFLSKNNFDNSEDFIIKIFSLPMYVELKDEQVHYVCDCLGKL